MKRISATIFIDAINYIKDKKKFYEIANIMEYDENYTSEAVEIVIISSIDESIRIKIIFIYTNIIDSTKKGVEVILVWNNQNNFRIDNVGIISI